MIVTLTVTTVSVTRKQQLYCSHDGVHLLQPKNHLVTIIIIMMKKVSMKKAELEENLETMRVRDGTTQAGNPGAATIILVAIFCSSASFPIT